MAKVKIIEWEIENFSCWCEAVHGKSIKSPDFLNIFGNAELFPRGGSGQDDNMVVRFCNLKNDLTGELSFIDFDGSSICSQQLQITQKGETVLGPSVGPKFDEVVAQIRGKAEDQDQITLRFCIQSDVDFDQRLCTTIGVWNVSLKIDPKLIENIESNNTKDILYFRYTSKEKKGIRIKLARRQDERIQLIMQPNDAEEKAVLVEISLSMLSSDNELVRNEVIKHMFIDGEAWMFSESLTVKELEENGFTILLQLKVINGEIVERFNYNIKDKKVSIVKNTSVPRFTEQLPFKRTASSASLSEYSTTELKKELMCLYQDQDFSDITLYCDDVSFPVHRAILSARSPVFKTMLSSDMVEAASSEVDIGDLDPSTLTRFLAFLYTGAVEELQGESTLKLYYAADKYQVPSLKRECTDFLCDKMSIENVCDVLTLADKHKDENLTAVSHNFIVKNYNDVLGSKQWENFMESEPMLALKTVTYFAKKKYVGNMHNP